MGHFGTTPGLNLIYAHLNRVIAARDLDMIYVIGPGHGGPGIVANSYLEGSYTEIYPHITQDEDGLRQLFRQFSFPGGIPSHVSPGTPGSIHEGGELGYSLMHAYGAAFDNPDLVVTCVIGDGEAETAPLAGSWHSNKFLDPVGDGAVLPILHLNGYKIANPTVLARIGDDELRWLLEGYGHRPVFVAGDDPFEVHEQLAAALDRALDEIADIQTTARRHSTSDRPAWPMIVMRTPKGWTGPQFVDGLPVEGTFRAHQIPVGDVRANPEHLAILEAWMRSYRAETLRRVRASPRRSGRLGAIGRSPNGLESPRRRRAPTQGSDCAGLHALCGAHGTTRHDVGGTDESARRNAPRRHQGESQHLPLGWARRDPPNRLGAVFEVTERVWEAEVHPNDEHLAPQGRVMEVLSEHLCEGWLEGYLLTGRHGLFNCYEAFVPIIDSMVNQHAKWLKTCQGIPWRRPIASLNYLLTSHVWRQDHNGFSHQDTGFIDHLVNKNSDRVRIYLPPDANTLLSVADHCLKSRDYVNLVVVGKQPALTYLSMDEAVAHCTRGLGIFEWASNDAQMLPDVVLACAGDVPTLETVAAAQLLDGTSPRCG